MRKRAFIWLVATGLFFVLPAYAAAQKMPMTDKVGKGQVLVSYLEGKAEVLPKGERGWYVLKLNDVLRSGDEVSVGKQSRLEITLPDQSKLRFADVTRFRILQVSEGETEDFKVHLAVGRTWANIAKALGLKRKYEISCENAVAGVRGTVYRMNVNEDKSALVRVYDGEVAVSSPPKPMDKGEHVFGKQPTRIEGPKRVPGPHKITMEEWTVLLRSMQQISIRADGVADKPREFTEQEDRDEWVDWNKERDNEDRQQATGKDS